MMKHTFLFLFLLMSIGVNSQDLNMKDLSKHSIKNLSVDSLDYFFIEKGEGETIFFLHGFPDLANTWDETMDSLSSKYHCVAPFLRGYFPTGIPKDGDYSAKTIARDIDSLAQKMGIDKYYIVGQDWGASVTYACLNLFPEKIIKAITIAVPHPSAISANIRTLYKARHFLKLINETKSVKYTRKKNYKYLDVLYQRWSPNWVNYTKTSEQTKTHFDLEGRLEAALGYYWSFNQTRKDESLSVFNNQIAKVPLMTMAGKQDGAVVLKQYYKMEKMMGADFELIVDDNAGHFLHRENHTLFLNELIRFFEKPD